MRTLLGFLALPFFIIGVIVKAIILGFHAGIEWCENLSEKR